MIDLGFCLPLRE